MTIIPGPPQGTATVDFEVYSEAGFFISDSGLWKSTVKGKPGIQGVGTYNYARHPSTRIRSLAYDLHDGAGIRIWFPGMPVPQDLFDHIARGGLIEAHNSIFEWWIWKFVCHERMDWPYLPLEQMTCTMSRCAASGLPQALGNVHHAIDMPIRKQDIGDALIKRLCVPHNFKKPKYTIGQLHEYCMQDVAAEHCLSDRIPALSALEREIWLMDQRINDRGVQIDVAATKALARRVEKYVSQAGRELAELTDGAVDSPRQVERMGKWLETRAIKVARTKKGRYKLDKAAVENLFSQVSKGSIEYQLLILRQQFSLASVDKIKTMAHMVDASGRLRGLFRYFGAHTGRWTSLGVQLQNLAKGKLRPEEVRRILDEIKCDNWSSVEGESPLAVIASLIRGLFIAAPGHELVSADFSAIEGVGAAMLSHEQWRIDVFRGDGKIYERTASDITGVSLEEILGHPEIHGVDHPIRKLGKVAELASAYQGWDNAWLQFGAGRYLPDKEKRKQAILRWRAKSPNIVDMWGGQVRKHPDRWEWTRELWGIEGAIIKAIQHPNEVFKVRELSFKYETLNDVLLMGLPSGRSLWYRQPRLHQKYHKHSGYVIWRITYKTWSSADKWHDKDTFGGRVFENGTQAVCRDPHALAMLRLEASGYPTVIHVHDEPVMEVPRGSGSLDEIKAIMEQTYGWFADWPIRVGTPWRGDFFRKD